MSRAASSGNGASRAAAGTEGGEPAMAPHLGPVLDAAATLGMQADVDGAARALAEAALELCGADRARVLIHVVAQRALRVVAAAGTDAGVGEVHGCGGLAGAVVHGGRGVAVPFPDGAAGFRSDLDDPLGEGDERAAELLAAPLLGVDHCPVGVLIAARAGARGPFSSAQRDGFDSLALHASPMLALQLLRASLADAQAGPAWRPHAGLFREAALEQLVRPEGGVGAPLRIAPRWLLRSVPALWAALAVAALVICLVRVRVRAPAGADQVLTERLLFVLLPGLRPTEQP
jgi:hypothetical protein